MKNSRNRERKAGGSENGERKRMMLNREESRALFVDGTVDCRASNSHEARKTA